MLCSNNCSAAVKFWQFCDCCQNINWKYNDNLPSCWWHNLNVISTFWLSDLVTYRVISSIHLSILLFPLLTFESSDCWPWPFSHVQGMTSVHVGLMVKIIPIPCLLVFQNCWPSLHRTGISSKWCPCPLHSTAANATQLCHIQGGPKKWNNFGSSYCCNRSR